MISLLQIQMKMTPVNLFDIGSHNDVLFYREKEFFVTTLRKFTLSLPSMCCFAVVKCSQHKYLYYIDRFANVDSHPLMFLLARTSSSRVFEFCFSKNHLLGFILKKEWMWFSFLRLICWITTRLKKMSREKKFKFILVMRLFFFYNRRFLFRYWL